MSAELKIDDALVIRHLSRWIALGLIATIALLGYDRFLEATIAASTFHQSWTICSVDWESELRRFTRNFTKGNDLVSKRPPNIILTPANGSAGDDDVKLSIWHSLALPEGLSTAFYEDFEELPLRPYEPTSTLLHHCRSSNCTFDVFDSLAICSACHNISERIVKVRTPYDSESKTVDNFLSSQCANQDDCFTWGLNVDQDLQMETPVYLANRRGYLGQFDPTYIAGSGRVTETEDKQYTFSTHPLRSLCFNFSKSLKHTRQEILKMMSYPRLKSVVFFLSQAI